MERRQSLKLKNDIENRPKREHVFDLERENEVLKIKLQDLQSSMEPSPLPTSEVAILDILEHDRQEALEDRQDLVNRLYSLHEEVRQAEELRDKYLEEKEDLELKCSTLQKDCEMYRNRMNTIIVQLDEAFRARDDAQHQFSQSLANKDKYRKQIRELEERSDELHIEIVRKEAKQVTLESRLRRMSLEQTLPRDQGQSECSSDEFQEDNRKFFLQEESRLRRRLNVKAPGKIVRSPVFSAKVLEMQRNSEVNRLASQTEESPEVQTTNLRLDTAACPPSLPRNRNYSILSTFPVPPEKASLYRREREKDTDFYPRSFSDFDSDNMDMEYEDDVQDGPPSIHSSSSSHQSEGLDSYDLEQVNTILRKLSLERPFRLSLSSFTRVSSSLKQVQELSLKGDTLLKDISLVGGNDSGIFISSVQSGSSAEVAGLREGHHLILIEGCIRGENQGISLETSTQEEAHWTLQHCSGPIQLHYRANFDAYHLLQGALADGVLTSGDSFYIRVNLNIWGPSDSCSLSVLCDEVVHVLDTRHQGRCQWLCARVEPYTGVDLPDSGTIPRKEENEGPRNVRNSLQPDEAGHTLAPQASPRLSRASVFITQILQFVSRMDNKYKRMNSSERVRIVTSGSDGSLPRGFESVREEGEEEPDVEMNSLNLIPYSPVTPQRSQRRRPVLFTPATLAGVVLQRLLHTAGNLDLCLCKPDILTKEEFQLRQRVEPFVHYKEKLAAFECISREKLEDVAAKGMHCLLEAELSCVKDLLRREIYPIIIFIKICDRNVKRLRKFPLRVESEDDFVRQCRSKEKELEGLACLYTSVEPDAWAGPDDLIRVVKERIVEEQRKMVWVEQDLL
ncbi:hypothetical protein NHX12_032407 [Muraenolepis orangiensis]|uniref:Uncharacterized protein n=1 Tax=Muraenolepis orangiensis TaxID=630683 RepID=A0A9Q0E7G5_9TELE|nr:hypothetical protein NHX12_032407 [Muraenolepis orangiensis]